MQKENRIDSNLPRQYRLGKRQAAINETRAKIIEAARELILSERALAGFSLDAVAKQAGVARMTVYNQFGGKPGLLEVLFDDIARRGGMFQLAAVFQEENGLDSLDGFIHAFGRFWNSERVILRRLHAMNRLDAEMGKADAARQSRRRKGLEKILARMQEKGEIKSDFTTDETIEILQTLTSFATFDSLAGDTKSPIEVVPTVQKIARRILKIK